MTYAVPWYCSEFLVAYYLLLLLSHFVHANWEGYIICMKKKCQGVTVFLFSLFFLYIILYYFRTLFLVFEWLSFSNGKMEVNLIVWASPTFDILKVSIWCKLHYYFCEVAYKDESLWRTGECITWTVIFLSKRILFKLYLPFYNVVCSKLHNF